MTGPLRLLMLAACVVGGVSLAACLAIVVAPDMVALPELAAGKPLDAVAEAAVAESHVAESIVPQDATILPDAVVPPEQPTAIVGEAPAPDEPSTPVKSVVSADGAGPSNSGPVPRPTVVPRVKPGPFPYTLTAHEDPADPAADAGVTRAQYVQVVPEETPAPTVIRFKADELADADDGKGHPRASTKNSQSTTRGEPARLRDLPFRDRAIARPSMSRSAGSRANDGHNDGRVVQVQYQAPQYITPRPAFTQQVGPGSSSSGAGQSSDGSAQPSAQSNNSPATGNDGNPGGPTTIPLNGPWAAGPPPGPGGGAQQNNSQQQQTNAPQQAPVMQQEPAPSDEPEEPAEQEPRPNAIPTPPRMPRAKIEHGEGDRNLTIHIQDTDLREVLDLLSDQGGLNILASNSVEGRVSASLTNVDVDTALSAILKSTGYTVRREGKFIYVGTPKDFQGMTQASDRLGSRVYRLNYVKASEFQALITPLLSPNNVGMISVTPPSQIGIAADGTNTGGDTFYGNETVLVRDYEGVLDQIDQVFQEIDVRPMQVAIEAMILSVELDDKNSFGVNFQFLRNEPNVAFASGNPPTNIGQVSFANNGLQFGFLDSSLGSFINALETIGDTNVIATPRLTCLNKHKAEILIGSQQGYVNSTSQNLTSTTQAVAFLETGTQLRLRPFISNDGMIRMEVHPESSTGTVTLVGGFTLPNKDVTQVTTNVMVPDGRTVIIGGLMREELDKTSNQIPLLGSLPGIGWLFRNKTETIARHELIVLITPHIVYEPAAGAEGDKAACDFHRRQAVYQDQMSPISTRFLGRKYFRLAQSAWAAGDGNAALRFINLSIHFDPLARAAIDLRSDIMAGNHQGPHSGGATLAGNPADLDGKEVPPWLLDNLDPAGGPPVAPYSTLVHPMEPSPPGRIRNIVRPGGMQ